MEMMKKYKFPSVFLFALIALVIWGCVSWQKNYGKLKIIQRDQNEITIQNLIDKWDDYHIYSSDQYAGPGFRSPLGIMFDPKNNDTTLVGDRWKKVSDQKTLTDMTKRIFLATQYEPWLNKMYVFNLEEPPDKGGHDE